MIITELLIHYMPANDQHHCIHLHKQKSYKNISHYNPDFGNVYMRKFTSINDCTAVTGKISYFKHKMDHPGHYQTGQQYLS